MVASVEAIFLSTFVLISQNRMAAAAEKRADLDLQINLLSEHEITKLVSWVSAIADRIGVEIEVGSEVEELKTRCRAGSGPRRNRGGRRRWRLTRSKQPCAIMNAGREGRSPCLWVALETV